MSQTTIASGTNQRRILQEEEGCTPVDFSGKYELGFTVICSEVGSDVCATFVDDNGGDKFVHLFVSLQFQVSIKFPYDNEHI